MITVEVRLNFRGDPAVDDLAVDDVTEAIQAAVLRVVREHITPLLKGEYDVDVRVRSTGPPLAETMG